MNERRRCFSPFTLVIRPMLFKFDFDLKHRHHCTLSSALLVVITIQIQNSIKNRLRWNGLFEVAFRLLKLVHYPVKLKFSVIAADAREGIPQ